MSKEKESHFYVNQPFIKDGETSCVSLFYIRVRAEQIQDSRIYIRLED